VPYPPPEDAGPPRSSDRQCAGSSDAQQNRETLTPSRPWHGTLPIETLPYMSPNSVPPSPPQDEPAREPALRLVAFARGGGRPRATSPACRRREPAETCRFMECDHQGAPRLHAQPPLALLCQYVPKEDKLRPELSDGRARVLV